MVLLEQVLTPIVKALCVVLPQKICTCTKYVLPVMHCVYTVVVQNMYRLTRNSACHIKCI